jgi:hypothetical protein
MAGKLERLLGDFAWGRMDALAAREALRPVPFSGEFSA